MNKIPEGKKQISIEAMYKEPIEGVSFSNAGITIGVSKYIGEGEGELEKELDEQVEKLCELYFRKLTARIIEGRNEVKDKVRVELDKKYKEYIKQLKEEIVKLKKK